MDKNLMIEGDSIKHELIGGVERFERAKTRLNSDGTTSLFVQEKWEFNRATRELITHVDPNHTAHLDQKSINRLNLEFDSLVNWQIKFFMTGPNEPPRWKPRPEQPFFVRLMHSTMLSWTKHRNLAKAIKRIKEADFKR